MPFEKGQSGNPNGRPKKNSATADRLREEIGAHVPAIIKAVVEQAKDGDVQAAKLLLDRVVPALKPQQQPVVIDDMAEREPSDQGKAIIEAMAGGRLTPEQGQAMLAGLASLMKIVEVDELEKRITALERHTDDS